MTWIFFSPAAVRMTSNSVFSSAAAAAAGTRRAPGMAATATGAAADTPHFSWSILLELGRFQQRQLVEFLGDLSPRLAMARRESAPRCL